MKTLMELLNEHLETRKVNRRIERLEEDLEKVEKGELTASKKAISSARSKLEVYKSLLNDPAVVQVVTENDDYDTEDAGKFLKRQTDLNKKADLENETYFIMSGLAWKNILVKNHRGHV